MTTVCVQLWAWAGDRGVRGVGVLDGAQARLATQVLVSSAAPGGGRLGRLGEPVTRTLPASGLVGALVALVPPDSMVRLDGHGPGHGKAPPRVLATVGSGQGRPTWVGAWTGGPQGWVPDRVTSPGDWRPTSAHDIGRALVWALTASLAA